MLPPIDPALLKRDTQSTRRSLARLQKVVPANSAYVVHRIRVVSKALELLVKTDRASQEKDELAALLGALVL